MVAGHAAIVADAEPARLLQAIVTHLDVAPLSVTYASTLDVGYALYHQGFHSEFLQTARQFNEALVPYRRAVVLSQEALHALHAYYRDAGIDVDIELHDVTEFILPFLSGVEVFRLDEKVGYFQGCHFSQTAFDQSAPEELLARLLQHRPVILSGVGCCGGTGCMPSWQSNVSRTMAEEVFRRAEAAGVSRIVTFSIACLGVLRDAAPEGIRVEHGLSLVMEALRVDQP